MKNIRNKKNIVLGVIPARYNSTRFPGKPLININGKTMIQRVYEQAKKSKLLFDVIVATDNKRIFDCVNSFGGNVMLTSKKHKSGTDRICEVAEKFKAELYVNIQGDEPFIAPDNIDKAIRPLIENSDINVSTLAIKMTSEKEIRDFNKVKVVFDSNNFAMYFSRSVIPFERDGVTKLEVTQRVPGNERVDYYKHIGLYVYRGSFLEKYKNMKQTKLELVEKLEQLRILENGEKIKVILTNKDSQSVTKTSPC